MNSIGLATGRWDEMGFVLNLAIDLLLISPPLAYTSHRLFQSF